MAAVSACHMLWYLHLCADAGIVVTAYDDPARGAVREHRDGSGEFGAVVLRPRVTLAAGATAADRATAARLHGEVHRYCCLARSVNFPVTIEPVIEAGS